MKKSVTSLSPAKINLCLHITGHDPVTNFHHIESVIGFTRWGDIITISESYCDHLTVIGNDNIPDDDDNLIFKVKHELEKMVGSLPSFHINLIKNIPIKAGLGGGSSNAATFLNLLHKFYLKNMSFETLVEVGRRVGADIPVCLYKAPCIVKGFGEDIRLLSRSNISYPIIIAKPKEGLETKDIFNELFEKENISLFGQVEENKIISEAFGTGRNDLRPISEKNNHKIKEIIGIIEKYNPIKTDMSGSGSACFGIFNNKKDSILAMKYLQNNLKDIFVVSSIIDL